MTETTASLVARLRTGLTLNAADPTQQMLYERWMGEEQWPLQPVAVALLVGVAPERWQDHVEALAMDEQATQLAARLVADLGSDGAAMTNGLRLRAWAEGQGVALPAAAEQLLDFVARTLPRMAAEAPPAATASPRATDKEAVLGAALALVTRFTEDCLDEERMFDGARIARLMLAQSALWFAEGPPRMSEQAIAELVEHYISGF